MVAKANSMGREAGDQGPAVVGRWLAARCPSDQPVASSHCGNDVTLSLSAETNASYLQKYGTALQNLDKK